MSDRVSGLPAPVQNVLQRAGELYEGFLDSLDDLSANDAVRAAIGRELDEVRGLFGAADNIGLVNRLVRAAEPPYGGQPNPDVISRMANLFASDEETRSLASRRGYDPDLVRDLLRERLLPNRG